MQRQRKRGLDLLLRQALEHARIANGREHQILVPDAAIGAEQIDGFEYVVEVVCRLAHAHEHDFLHRAKAAGKGDLGDDFSATQLAQQAALASHAEQAAHRATDLAGYT